MGEITNAHKISVEKLKEICRKTPGAGGGQDEKACYLNLSGSGQGPVVLFCEHDNEL
jgi:hypothetical protein